jgi:hypothetical protein
VGKAWYEIIQDIDRRIIYLVVFLVVSIPFFLSIRAPMEVGPPAQHLFDCVENIAAYNKTAPKEKIVLIIPEWDPAVQAECKPQTRAMMEHCMKRGVKFATMSWFYPQGVELAEKVAEECEKKYKKKYGVDWVSWGYKPFSLATFLAFIKDIYTLVEKDSKDTSIREVPLMKNVDSLRDVGLVFYVSGGSGIGYYINYALPEIGFSIGTGCTAILGPEMRPYLDSRQLVGMMEGMAGAAQYEKLLEFKEGRGTRGMGSQSFAHLWIIFTIALGNVGYLVHRRRLRKAQKGE